MTLLIESTSDDTYFNLASEEYLLQEFEEDVIFIYENRPAVVVGKHQNVFDECQILKCQHLNIDIARRLSGGGTVYHGPGNINFCFIKNLKPEEPMVDFKRHLQPVITYLNNLGLPATFSGRNDILLKDFKISGSAEHVFQKKRRLIHHGTLLFNADLASLSGTTSAKTEIEFQSHAVKSVRSKVTNIAEYLNNMTQTEFTIGLSNHLASIFKAQRFELEEDSSLKIKKLVEEKYRSWDWIFGYSPAFTAKTLNQWEFRVKKGIIESATYRDQPKMILVGKPFILETFKDVEFAEIAGDWF